MGFFNLRKPKQFEYKPRFFDPVKERREERRKEMARELGIEEDSNKIYVPRMRPGAFRENIRRGNNRAKKKSNLRLMIIVFILILISYLMFYR